LEVQKNNEKLIEQLKIDIRRTKETLNKYEDDLKKYDKEWEQYQDAMRKKEAFNELLIKYRVVKDDARILKQTKKNQFIKDESKEKVEKVKEKVVKVKKTKNNDKLIEVNA